ncbi:ABC transporter substrate-binding protein [Ectothiorhodospiraceae bacterium BW-2]|nr:ABC transporter substrate-binding protein [Ectothiorhodospiraceae bacterium BW-2]
MLRLAYPLMILSLLLATVAAYATPSERSQNPALVLQQGIETLANPPQSSPMELQRYLEQHLVPYFDFEAMARQVAGPLYRRLNPTQRDYLRKLLQNEVLTTVAKGLNQYRDSEIRYYPAARHHGNQVLLRAELNYPNQPRSLQLAFRLHNGPQGWRVVDVIANGLSAVSHYRYQYQNRMRPGPSYSY